MAFIMMFAWFNQKNAGYLIGGSLPMAERMTKRYLDLGGRLTTRARVSKIVVENNSAKGVILSDGTELKADYVISAADGHSTIFDMLDGKFLNKKITHAYENWELFTPLVQVSFGINKIISAEAPAETWMIRDQKIGKTTSTGGYSIMNYSFDRTMAPEGKSVIVMRFESPWDLWKDMDKAEYEREKKQIESDAKTLLEKRYPGISESIEVCDVATPVTDVNYTGVWKGSYEGFLPSSKNMMDNINPVLPGLKKFYMAGQWLFPGGGLPPAGQSGKWAVQNICKEEKIKFRVA
jgi:phytoene dehydrogenase-like protein